MAKTLKGAHVTPPHVYRRAGLSSLFLLLLFSSLPPPAAADFYAQGRDAEWACEMAWPVRVACGSIDSDDEAGTTFLFGSPTIITVDALVVELDFVGDPPGAANRFELEFPPPETAQFSVESLPGGNEVSFVADRGRVITGDVPMRVLLRARGDAPLMLYNLETGEGLTFRARLAPPSLTNFALPGATSTLRMAVSWFGGEDVPAGYAFTGQPEPAAAAPESPASPQAATLTSAALTRLTLTISLAIGAAVGLAWFGRRALLAAGVGLFSRVERDAVLDHPSRNLLESLVRSDPGIPRDAARSRLGVGRTAFEYHLRLLARHGLLRCAPEFGVARLYPGGSKTIAPAVTVPARFLALVAAEPGLRQIDAANRLGLSEKTVGYHATWLARKGLVVRRQDGRVVRYYRT